MSDNTNTTVVMPQPNGPDMRRVRDKTAKGGVIGAVAVLAGTLIAGAIGANNPDKIDPVTQQTIAGVVTTVVAGLLSGIWNWIKHRRG